MNNRPQIPVPDLGAVGKPQQVNIPMVLNFTLNLDVPLTANPHQVARQVKRLQQAVLQVLDGQEVAE